MSRLIKFLKGENPLFSIIYLFGILLLMISPPCRAQDASPVIVSSAIPSDRHPRAGEKVSIAINFDMTGSAYLLGSFSGTLTWDPALLQYQGHSGILAGFSGEVEDLAAGDGAIIFRGSNSTGRGEVFDILALHFLAREPGGNSTTVELEYLGITAPHSSFNLLPFLIVNKTVLRIGRNFAPNIQLPVTFYHFGAHPVGSTTTQVFWINNIGAEPLLVSATEITGSAAAEFTIIEGGAPFTVLPWQGHPLIVGFTPASAGAKTARLNIYSNDPDENPAIIDLAGTGLNPPSGVVVSAAIPSSPEPQSGDTLSAGIRVDMSGMAAPDHLLGSFTGMLTWDPAVLQYSGNSGVLQGFSGVVDDGNASAGVLLFNGANAAGQGGAFDVLKINFTAAGEEGSSTIIDLEYIGMLAALTFTDLMPFLTIQDGMVTVSGANQDYNPPDCVLLGINPGPPATLEVRLQDGESGLAQVNVLVAVNVEVDIPAFSPGTTDPVIVSATKIDPNHSSTLTLEVFDVAGHSSTCDPVYTLLSSITPEHFTLEQNYPNPFNPATTIEFGVAAPDTRVSLKIYDLTGRLVKTLMNEEVVNSGYYRVTWNGTTDKGDPAAAGIYLCRMAAGGFAQTRRMMLVK